MSGLLPPVQVRPPLDRPPLVPIDYQGRQYLVEDLETFREHAALTRQQNLLQADRPQSAPPPSHAAGEEALGKLLRAQPGPEPGPAAPTPHAPTPPTHYSLAQ